MFKDYVLCTERDRFLLGRGNWQVVFGSDSFVMNEEFPDPGSLVYAARKHAQLSEHYAQQVVEAILDWAGTQKVKLMTEEEFRNLVGKNAAKSFVDDASFNEDYPVSRSRFDGDLTGSLADSE